MPAMRDDQHQVDDEALVAQRPVGKVEAAHLARSLGQADLLTFAQAVDAGGDDDVALGQAAR